MYNSSHDSSAIHEMEQTGRWMIFQWCQFSSNQSDWFRWCTCILHIAQFTSNVFNFNFTFFIRKLFYLWLAVVQLQICIPFNTKLIFSYFWDKKIILCTTIRICIPKPKYKTYIFISFNILFVIFTSFMQNKHHAKFPQYIENMFFHSKWNPQKRAKRWNCFR